MDEMVNASETSINNISVSDDFGMLIPKYSPPRQTAFEFYLEKLSSTVSTVKSTVYAEVICDNPKISDPYESKFVEVKASLIETAGEGLFTKRNIVRGKVVAYFNGVRISSDLYTESSDYSISISQPINIRSNIEYRKEKQQTVTMLDIPREYRSSEMYCATLAHKICHSFQPNASYDYAFHPRFGFIRCAVAIRDIKEGEEVTCDYKYSLTKDPPKWYIKCLNKYLMDVFFHTVNG